MSEVIKCDVCQKPAPQKCGGCHNVHYCSKDHQKIGWKTHKKNCRPFKISENESLGRHLVATRPIKFGEVILKEPPIIWGPSQVTVPVCLGCGKGLSSNEHKPCTKCGWPMCNEMCQFSPSHIPECHYTTQREDKVHIKNFDVIHPTYQSITVLRCLYQKQFMPDVWKKIDRLQSHCLERKKNDKYESDRVTVAQFIRRFFKLEKHFTEEEILRLCGIIMINGHEVPLTDPSHLVIYETTSMFEHSCRANCCKSFTSQGSILITAGVAIEKGDHLSICYTDPLWGTTNRRYHLYESKFFWCSCERCADPTEFGTCFSALKCQNTQCKGLLLPNSVLDDNTKWTCNQCQKVTNAYAVQDIVDHVGKDLDAMEKSSSSACKLFLEHYGKFLHSNHYYIIDVKLALAQIIGQESENGLNSVSDEDLELKTKLCQQIYELLKCLIPAEKRVRGMVLFELHAAISEIGRRKAITDGPGVLHTALMDSRKILQETVELLENEPVELPEGKVCEQAKINLQNMETVLRTVHKNIGDSFG